MTARTLMALGFPKPAVTIDHIEIDGAPMLAVTVPQGHAYFNTMVIEVVAAPGSKWLVVWRDFLTVKQDRECDDRDSAIAFAQELQLKLMPPLTLNLEVTDKEVFDAEHFWVDLENDR